MIRAVVAVTALVGMTRRSESHHRHHLFQQHHRRHQTAKIMIMSGQIPRGKCLSRFSMFARNKLRLPRHPTTAESENGRKIQLFQHVLMTILQLQPASALLLPPLGPSMYQNRREPRIQPRHPPEDRIQHHEEELLRRPLSSPPRNDERQLRSSFPPPLKSLKSGTVCFA